MGPKLGRVDARFRGDRLVSYIRQGSIHQRYRSGYLMHRISVEVVPAIGVNILLVKHRSGVYTRVHGLQPDPYPETAGAERVKQRSRPSVAADGGRAGSKTTKRAALRNDFTPRKRYFQQALLGLFSPRGRSV